jgi:hypothetical protein
MPFYTDCCINQLPYLEPTKQLGKASHMASSQAAKTFLITGVSSGFGRALAEAALRDAP